MPFVFLKCNGGCDGPFLLLFPRKWKKFIKEMTQPERRRHFRQWWWRTFSIGRRTEGSNFCEINRANNCVYTWNSISWKKLCEILNRAGRNLIGPNHWTIFLWVYYLDSIQPHILKINLAKRKLPLSLLK